MPLGSSTLISSRMAITQAPSNQAHTSANPVQLDNEQKDTCYDTFCYSSICEGIKQVIMTAVVFLMIGLALFCIGMNWQVFPVHPAGCYIIMICCLILLAYVEALHYGAVAIEKWDMSLYADKFPRAARCHALVNTEEKVKKFLVGRQFFVIFVVFVLAQILSFHGIPHHWGGIPDLVLFIFVEVLPGVFIILTVGQLISQIFVEEFTLQFMNLPGCEFVIRLALGAEYIGICNFSWLLFGLTSHFMCSKVRRVRHAMESSKSNLTIETTPQSPTELNRPNYKSGNPSFNFSDLNWFDYLKYLWSSGVTLGSLGLICYGISIRAYILPAPVPAAYITAIVLMIILFYLEGLMIAIVATQYWDPETWRDVYPRAYAIHKLVNRPDCVKRFIIGRQFYTVFTNFLLAQIFTFVNWKVTNMNPVLFFLLFKSGLVGVFVILAFAQLLSQLMATEFPLRFMDMFGSYSITVMCLFFDSIGVGHCAWSLYYLTRSLFCGHQMEEGRASHDSKPTLIKVDSPEVMMKTTPSLATMA